MYNIQISVQHETTSVNPFFEMYLLELSILKSFGRRFLLLCKENTILSKVSYNKLYYNNFTRI